MSNDPWQFSPDFQRAHHYFQEQPHYAISPLHTMAYQGHNLLVKDETDRMGLGAFKALGGPYAIARYIMQRWQQKTGQAITAQRLQDPDVKAWVANLTFVCASAGNHGVGVAAGAQYLSAKARIFLADTVPKNFAARLEAYGAQVQWAGENYSQSVQAAITNADATGGILLADGTWEGYVELPKLVMEGYTVIAEEIRQSLASSQQWPSHVFLQAGVGGLACAMAYMIRHNWQVQPEIYVVEPEAAPCLQASHQHGQPTNVEGPDSNMGRLDCKEPSIVAWHCLEACNVHYVTLTDEEASVGASTLGSMGVATTPSGGAGFTALTKLMPTLLSETSHNTDFLPLVIASEGQV